MQLFVADRSSVDTAQALIEAAARADKSRDLGNHIHYCRWRQIERLVVLMSVGRAVGTVH